MKREPVPDTYPRYALVVDQYYNIKPVLIASLDREMSKGMGRIVVAREDAEMYHQYLKSDIDTNLQSNPRRGDEPDGA